MELSFYWKKTEKKSKICGVLKDVICAMGKKKSQEGRMGVGGERVHIKIEL